MNTKTNLYGYTLFTNTLNKTLHKTDGPALKVKSPAGDFLYELFYKNGKLHNMTGPAFMSSRNKAYYIEGEIYDYEDYIFEVAKIVMPEFNPVKSNHRTFITGRGGNRYQLNDITEVYEYKRKLKGT